MTATYERGLLARAHGLAGTEDLAEEVTAILGGGRAARVDPDALPGLAGAALALGAGSLTVYRAGEPLFADDGEFAEAIEEADAEIAGRAAAVARLADEAAAAVRAAHAALEAARAALDDARAMPVYRPCDGCHAARDAAVAAAEEHIKDAEERLAYAREAAAVLERLAARLRHALACLRRVMGDLADTYESVYDLRRSGHVMPKDGDWLQGRDRAAADPTVPGSGGGVAAGQAATAMTRYEAGDSGQVIGSRELWALVDQRREGGNRLHYSRGAFRADDGTWYWPQDMSEAERAGLVEARQRDLWWEEHKRDTSVIPSLSDSDLQHFRLLADIRADMPALEAATAELRRRGIRDYPAAI